jgi:hypothetical protein
LSQLQDASAVCSSDGPGLRQELEIHQLELEMQNRELREAQSALESSRAHYAELYDGAPIGYLTLDRHGWILQTNLTAAAILGRDRDELLGAPFASAASLRDPTPFFAHLREAARSDRPVTDELESAARDGNLLLQATTRVAARVPPKERQEFRMTLLDVTERRVAEMEHAALDKERRARAEADAANHMKDQFIGMVSHELRTPLNAVLGWAQILSSTERDPRLLERGLALMLRNGKSMARLVDDILDVSRMASGKLRFDMKRVAMDGVVRNAIEDLRAQNTGRLVSIREDLSPSCGAHGDAERLEQVVRNLLSNALKFSEEGSEVRVSLEREEDSVKLVVSDTGHGIDKADLPRVFDRFRQGEDSTVRPYRGLGLGLAIARYIVEAHEGTIEAYSEGRGLGAVFTVRLPHQKPGSQPPAREFGPDSSHAPVQSVAGLAIVCVDDDEAGLELLEVALRSRGAAVRTARSVDDAMSIIPTLQPDVIVTDMAMAKRDGYDLLASVRAVSSLVAKTPVIAVTAFARHADEQQVHHAGFAGHLTKPIDIEAMVAAICRAAPR